MNPSHAAFGVLDWLVIIVYVAVMIGIGAWTSRKEKTSEDYFLGGRSMPVWAVSLSVLATTLSAATFIGVPQISYGGDLTYLILNIGGVIGALVVAFFIFPPLYRAGTITIYGYLGRRFGRVSVIAASVMFLLGRLLASGARLFMAAIAFALVLYGETQTRDLVMAIVILGAVGTLYTVFGGIKAVIWTDVIQICVMVFAALLSIHLLLDAIPLSAGEIYDALHHAADGDKLKILDTRMSFGLEYTLWTGAIASAFVGTAAYSVDHDMVQRMLTTKSARGGGLSLISSILLSVPVVCLFLFIGLLLSIYYGRPDLMGGAMPADALTDDKRVYPQFLLNHLPSGLKGLAMAGLFAAAMSSLDSAINAMASSVIADLVSPLKTPRGKSIEQGDALGASRLTVAAMGILLIGFAILAVRLQAAGGSTLIDFALGVMAFANAPLLGVFSAAIFTRRGNNASVLAALGAGAMTVLLLQPYMMQSWFDFELAWPWWTVIASTISFLVCIFGKPVERGA